MIFDLHPFERCGPLSRGLPFDRVAPTLGMAATAFRKSPMSEHDALDVSGAMHVFFDKTGGCEGVEFFTTSGLDVTCRGVALLGENGSALVDALVRLGQHWEVDTYGIRAPMLGIASFHPDFDWDAGRRSVGALYVSLDPEFVP